jgi:fucose permease
MIALPLPTDALALAGLVVAGLGSAPIYPAIIHSTPKNFGAHNSQAIIGIQMAAAYSGSTFMPPVFGALSSVTGTWIFPFYLAVFVILGIVLSERLNRRAARGELAVPIAE